MLEVQYEELLVEALRQAAADSWGLFDHNHDKRTRKTWEPTVNELYDLGEQIDQMRAALGLDPFPLYQEFAAARGPVPANAPGEPKQARAWLERMRVSL